MKSLKFVLFITIYSAVTSIGTTYVYLSCFEECNSTLSLCFALISPVTFLFQFREMRHQIYQSSSTSSHALQQKYLNIHWYLCCSKLQNILFWVIMRIFCITCFQFSKCRTINLYIFHSVRKCHEELMQVLLSLRIE